MTRTLEKDQEKENAEPMFGALKKKRGTLITRSLQDMKLFLVR